MSQIYTLVTHITLVLCPELQTSQQGVAKEIDMIKKSKNLELFDDQQQDYDETSGKVAVMMVVAFGVIGLVISSAG